MLSLQQSLASGKSCVIQITICLISDIHRLLEEAQQLVCCTSFQGPMSWSEGMRHSQGYFSVYARSFYVYSLQQPCLLSPECGQAALDGAKRRYTASSFLPSLQVLTALPLTNHIALLLPLAGLQQPVRTAGLAPLQKDCSVQRVLLAPSISHMPIVIPS